MIITPASLQALHTQFSLAFNVARTSAPIWSPKIVTQLSSNTKTNTYGFLEQTLKMRKWIGPRIAQNLSAKSHMIENEAFELTVELDRDDIEDDNLGMFQGVTIPMFGSAVAQDFDSRLAKHMQDNDLLAFDGLPLFDDTHLIGSNTYDNKGGAAFSADALEAAYNVMTGYVDEIGRPLMVRPNVLFHAPQLKRKVMQVLSAGTIATNALEASAVVGASAPENVMQGWMTPVEVPQWGDTPKMWVIADTTKGIMPFVRQIRRPYNFVQKTDASDANVFFEKKYYYGTEGREGLGVTMPWLVYLGNKST